MAANYLHGVETIEIETGVAVHKKRERDPKKMRHHVVSHLT